MKALYTILAFFMTFIVSADLYSQPGRKAVKQPPRINGVQKATSNATAKAKIHANSNSVFGTGTTHPKYDKKSKKGELRNEKDVAKKDKKRKK